MPAIIAQGDKKKALLTYKEELLLNLKHYDERIKNAETSLQNPSYFDDDESSDSDIELCIKETGPSITQLKSQESLLKTCLQATEELTSVEVLQSEVNVLMQEPAVPGEPPVKENGTWHEVTVECCVDLVPFAMMFFVHKGHRTFAPSSYRGLRVLPSKSAHEAELNKSVLPGLVRPSDAVEVLRSYAIAHRSRRSTLARLADKFGAALHMEPIATGGYLLKCANLLEVSWTLQNKWSPIAPFHHRMKFDLEYMDENYIKTITAAHRQLSDPSVDTDERTLLLAQIISTCLSAAPESDDSRRQVDSEVMAPPKSLPKKSRPKSNENTVETRKSVQKPVKRSNQETNNESTKKMKKSETQDVTNTGVEEKNEGKGDKEKVAKSGANDKNSATNVATEKNSTKSVASNNASTKDAAIEKSSAKNIASDKKSAKNCTTDTDSTKNVANDKKTKNNEVSDKKTAKNIAIDKNNVQEKDAMAEKPEKVKQKTTEKASKKVEKAKQKSTDKIAPESNNEGNNKEVNNNKRDAKKDSVATKNNANEAGKSKEGEKKKNTESKNLIKNTVSSAKNNVVSNSEAGSVASPKKKIASKEAANPEKEKNKTVVNKNPKETVNQNQENDKNKKLKQSSTNIATNKKASATTNLEKPKNVNEKPTNVANAPTNKTTKKPLVEKSNKTSKPPQNQNNDPKIFQSKPTIPANVKKVAKTGNTEKENKNGGEVKVSKIPQKKTTPVKGVFKKMAVRMSPRNLQEKPKHLVGKKVIQKPVTGIPRLMTKPTPKVT